MNRMDRNGKQENDKNACFYQCLQRVKSVSCPGGWIGAFMVHQVKNAKQLFVMHKPVRKIKISIMHKKHDGESQPKIEPAMLTNV